MELKELKEFRKQLKEETTQKPIQENQNDRN